MTLNPINNTNDKDHATDITFTPVSCSYVFNSVNNKRRRMYNNHVLIDIQSEPDYASCHILTALPLSALFSLTEKNSTDNNSISPQTALQLDRVAQRIIKRQKAIREDAPPITVILYWKAISNNDNSNKVSDELTPQTEEHTPEVQLREEEEQRKIVHQFQSLLELYNNREQQEISRVNLQRIKCVYMTGGIQLFVEKYGGAMTGSLLTTTTTAATDLSSTGESTSPTPPPQETGCKKEDHDDELLGSLIHRQNQKTRMESDLTNNGSLKPNTVMTFPKISDLLSNTVYPSEIIEDFLFLGTREHANDETLLRQLKICHVLNATNVPSCLFGRRIVKRAATTAATSTPSGGEYPTFHLQISLIDLPHVNIREKFEEAIQFMEQVRNGRREEERLLVHCEQGISRSATLVIAYLMYREKMKFEQALHLVKMKRRIAHPNPGFRKQLAQYEVELDELYNNTSTNNGN